MRPPPQPAGRLSSAWIRAQLLEPLLQRRVGRHQAARAPPLRAGTMHSALAAPADAQVALRDRRGLAADLLQRGAEGRRLEREVGAGPVGAELAVAREQAQQQEADGVHDEADDERRPAPRAGLLLLRERPIPPNWAKRMQQARRRCRPTRPRSSPARRGGRRGSARGPGPPRAPRRRGSAGSRSSRTPRHGRASGRWRRRWARPCRRCPRAAWACRPARTAGRSCRAAPGASSGVTSRARIARIATLSELHHCQNAMPIAMTATIGA